MKGKHIIVDVDTVMVEVGERLLHELGNIALLAGPQPRTRITLDVQWRDGQWWVYGIGIEDVSK